MKFISARSKNLYSRIGMTAIFHQGIDPSQLNFAVGSTGVHILAGNCDQVREGGDGGVGAEEGGDQEG